MPRRDGKEASFSFTADVRHRCATFRPVYCRGFLNTEGSAVSEKIASDRNDELADAESRTPEDPAPETRTAESEVRPEEGTDGTPAVDAAPADDKTGESSVVTNEPSGEPQEVSTREEPSEKDAALKETPAVEAAEKSAAEREAEDPKGSEAALPDSAEPAPAETRTEAEPVPVPVRKKSLVGKILLALLVLVLLAVAAAGVLYTQGNKKIFEELKAANSIGLPKWLEFDNATLTGKVVELPERSDVEQKIEEHLIVELYSK